jgi:hypothetical protein
MVKSFQAAGSILDSDKTGIRERCVACMRLMCSIHDVCSSVWKFNYCCKPLQLSPLLDVGSNPSTFPCKMCSYEYIAALNHWAFSFLYAVAGLSFWYRHYFWSISLSRPLLLGKVRSALRNKYLKRHFRASGSWGYSRLRYWVPLWIRDTQRFKQNVRGFRLPTWCILGCGRAITPKCQVLKLSMLRLSWRSVLRSRCAVGEAVLFSRHLSTFRRNLTTKQHGITFLKTVVVKPNWNWKVN